MIKVDQPVSVRFYKGHNKKLQMIADLRGLDKADIIRAAVKYFLDNYPDSYTSDIGGVNNLPF